MKKRKKKRHKKKSTTTKRQVLRGKNVSIKGEAKYIVKCAQRCEAKVVTLGKLLFFSTVDGDAWMLDPEDNLALRLAELGEPLPRRIMETAESFGVEWNAQYALTDNGFVVQIQDGKTSMFPTYPVQMIRDGERQTDKQR